MPIGICHWISPKKFGSNLELMASIFEAQRGLLRLAETFMVHELIAASWGVA